MAKFEVIASPDFQNGGAAKGGTVTLKHKTETETGLFGNPAPKTYIYVLAKDIVAAEVQTEDGVRKLSGAAGWGLAGVALAGPVGLLLGALWGGRKRNLICFSATMRDGKKFLAVAEPSVYRQFVAGAFGG